MLILGNTGGAKAGTKDLPKKTFVEEVIAHFKIWCCGSIAKLGESTVVSYVDRVRKVLLPLRLNR